MREGYASQFGTACVIIDGPADPDDVIEFAKQIGATSRAECEPEEAPDLVIDFRHDDTERGPELYTEDALRSSLATL